MPRDGLIYGRPFFCFGDPHMRPLLALEGLAQVHLFGFRLCVSGGVELLRCSTPGHVPGIHVYDSITEWDDFEPGSSRIKNIPTRHVDRDRR